MLLWLHVLVGGCRTNSDICILVLLAVGFEIKNEENGEGDEEDLVGG